MSENTGEIVPQLSLKEKVGTTMRALNLKVPWRTLHIFEAMSLIQQQIEPGMHGNLLFELGMSALGALAVKRVENDFKRQALGREIGYPLRDRVDDLVGAWRTGKHRTPEKIAYLQEIPGAEGSNY